MITLERKLNKAGKCPQWDEGEPGVTNTDSRAGSQLGIPVFKWGEALPFLPVNFQPTINGVNNKIITIFWVYYLYFHTRLFLVPQY